MEGGALVINQREHCRLMIMSMVRNGEQYWDFGPTLAAEAMYTKLPMRCWGDGFW